MNALTVVLLVASGVAAVIDWWALGRGDDRLEAAAKPAVLVLLIGAALAIDPVSSSLRWWFVGALVLSLVGDIALLPRFDAFLVGLGAFLLAHIAYVVGMAQHMDSWALAVVGLVVVVVATATVGRRIIESAAPELRIPVALYLLALAAMVVTAYATGSPFFAAGALSFFVSDSLLGWGRFVSPAPGGRVAVHVTYHLAQGLLVVGLA